MKEADRKCRLPSGSQHRKCRLVVTGNAVCYQAVMSGFWSRLLGWKFRPSQLSHGPKLLHSGIRTCEHEQQKITTPRVAPFEINIVFYFEKCICKFRSRTCVGRIGSSRKVSQPRFHFIRRKSLKIGCQKPSRWRCYVATPRAAVKTSAPWGRSLRFASAIRGACQTTAARSRFDESVSIEISGQNQIGTN
jgi:hypothetical protein